MFKKILMPVDVSNIDTQHKTFEIVRLISTFDAAEVTLLGVIPEITLQVMSDYLPKDLDKKAVDISIEILDKLARRLAEQGVKTDYAVKHGNIYKSILKYAEQNEIELIIIASQAPSVRDYLLGPNGSRVVKHASCSVLVVRA